MSTNTVQVIWDPACFHSTWHKKIYEGILKAAGTTQCAVRLLETSEDASGIGEPVILIGFSLDNLIGAVQSLAENKLRAILAGMDADSLSSQVSCVTHSRSRQTIDLLRYYYSYGRQRIAIVGVGRHSLNDWVKVDAAMRYTAKSPSPIETRDIYNWSSKLEESMISFLPEWKRYDAVICPNDYAAFSLIRFLKQNGVNVPDDLHIVGFSDQSIGRYLRPSITTITMNYSVIGQYAFMIWQMLRQVENEDLVCKMIAPGQLLARGSTAFQPPIDSRERIIRWENTREKDMFYQDDTIRRLMCIENCLNRHDSLDINLIHGILNGESYESLADRLFISLSALRYRVSKIYRDVGCRTKLDFIALFTSCYDRFEIADEG